MEARRKDSSHRYVYCFLGRLPLVSSRKVQFALWNFFYLGRAATPTSVAGRQRAALSAVALFRTPHSLAPYAPLVHVFPRKATIGRFPPRPPLLWTDAQAFKALLPAPVDIRPSRSCIGSRPPHGRRRHHHSITPLKGVARAQLTCTLETFVRSGPKTTSPKPSPPSPYCTSSS